MIDVALSVGSWLVVELQLLNSRTGAWFWQARVRD